MSHHRVEVRDVSFGYPDSPDVLRGVSFLITHGESVGIVGPNGAGKSTLLMVLTGCLWPTAGEVRIGDLPVTRKTLATVRRSVGVVLQQADDQLFMPTVLEDVAFGPLNQGLPPEEARAVAERALESVKASHLSQRPPYRLSFGEKRTAAIAAVLACSPDVLVMDEPSSDLDPTRRRTLIEQLKSFSHTKLIVTHDLDLALDVCDRIIVLKEGVISADGPAAELLRDEALLNANELELPLRLQAEPP
jgi:cobalt/nickel transport system ATP-binding protein